MIKIHKLEDGDVIKILPMIDKNDNISWIKSYDCVGNPGQTSSIITDNSGKGYLRRISNKIRESNSSNKLPYTTRHGMNIYIDGEIRILNVGKTLYEIIVNSHTPFTNLFDIRGNHQLFIVKREVSVGGGQFFPSYDKSYVSEKNWTPPVNNIHSQDEWFSYIKSNQPDFESYLRNNDIFKYKQSLIDYLGKDMLGELIVDDRNRKINSLYE